MNNKQARIDKFSFKSSEAHAIMDDLLNASLKPYFLSSWLRQSTKYMEIFGPEFLSFHS